MSTNTLTVQDKFKATADSMNVHLVDMHDAVELILISVLARANLFFYGTPGIAKTHSFRLFHKHLECPPGSFYEKLLDAFITKGDLVGPIDLEAYKNQGIQRHHTEGTMVTADFVLLDEIYKANGPLLNVLLKILNEHEFDNGNSVEEARLISLFGASNEFAADDSLAALSDRLHFWYIVKPVLESSSFIRVLKTRELPPPTPTLSLDDIRAAHIEVDAVRISDEVYEALDHIRGSLRRDDIHPTPRRFVSMLPAIQASAWLRGSNVADVDDMRIIRFGLWNRPEQLEVVTKHVLKLASPLEKEALEMMEVVDNFAADLDAIRNEMDTQHARSVGAIELDNKIAEARKDAEALRKRMVTAGKSTATIELAQQRMEGVLRSVLVEFFDFNDGDLDEAG
jgi:MoxR-like ATPase